MSSSDPALENMGILADRQKHRCAIYIHMYIHILCMYVCTYITCIYSVSYCRQTAEQEILRRISFEYLTRTRNNIILGPPGRGRGRGIDCFIALLPAGACCSLFIIVAGLLLNILLALLFFFLFNLSTLATPYSTVLSANEKGVLSQCFIAVRLNIETQFK